MASVSCQMLNKACLVVIWVFAEPNCFLSVRRLIRLQIKRKTTVFNSESLSYSSSRKSINSEGEITELKDEGHTRGS
uniref:Uncharacterized protein n=1 Tax=Tanacetum cinerariifolium TaxID=118510 RepID=A0A6L2JXL6_TANCI|nr:hypothetical protein [Tanacetum cinerariifolium]